MAIRSTRAASAPEHHPIPSGRNSETPPQSTCDRVARPTRRRTARRRLRSFVIAGTAALMLTGASGCSLVSNAYRQVRKAEYLDEFMLAHRNKVFATKAWLREKHCHKNRPHLNEFKAGFLEGYADVANGSDGCIPRVAPSQYWGWKYQSPGGQAAIDAWFAGYPLGVKAAEQDGVGYWGRAPMMVQQPPASDSDTAATPTEASTVLGPDGKPVPPEIIVPGSTRIIETTTPIESLPAETLAPPAIGSGQPAFDADTLSAPSLGTPALGDDAALKSNSDRPGFGGEVDSLVDAATLVPRQSATTYTLQDSGRPTVPLGEDAIEGIFGSIEMPANSSDASLKTNAAQAQSKPTGQADAIVETASADSDEIPFKFE
ncbi:hypothetical protein Enr13x_40810 [Stieleria neptunia]|uniref:Uncharacterized protein n=1 Tax=Stieleria neptunia TaxID=2527979 RepID=A0A518HTN8_9BACT|nr:hypothetical protein [Stieleria neptunia]QDV44219.1 hypothetical protein Enr13x_40810 [Stieleria neptunia]